MTAVDTIPDTLKPLDFHPACEGCDQPATYKIRLDCGCIGLLCLHCLKAMERTIRDCLDAAQLKGLTPFFDHADCGLRIWCWPIADVRPL